MTLQALFSAVPPAGADSEKSLDAFLDLLALPEKLGYSGIWLSATSADVGRGAGPPGLSPWQVLTLLAVRTEQISLGLWDLPLPVYGAPLEWGREIASLSRLSAGRLKVGVGLGAGEAYARLRVTPNDGMLRLREGVELWRKLFASPENSAATFDHSGQFWQARAIQPESLPGALEIWLSGNGSRELSELAVELRLHFAARPAAEISLCQTQFKHYRTALKKQQSVDFEPQRAWQVPFFLAEEDEQAWREFEPIRQQLAQQAERKLHSPPGLLSVTSQARLLKKPEQFLTSQKTRQELLTQGLALVGSPATVQEYLQQHLAQLGNPNILAQLHLPHMNHQQLERNLYLVEGLRVEG